MSDEPRYVGDADVQYNEFRGTCAFDDPQSLTMDELFKLPKDKYWVLGFHVFGGNDALDFGAIAYAIERSVIENYERSGTTNYDTLQAMAADNGGDIPVVEIETRISTEDVLRGLKRVSITAVADAAVNQPGWRLRIDKQLNLAEEPS